MDNVGKIGYDVRSGERYTGRAPDHIGVKASHNLDFEFRQLVLKRIHDIHHKWS